MGEGRCLGVGVWIDVDDGWLMGAGGGCGIDEVQFVMACGGKQFH